VESRNIVFSSLSARRRYEVWFVRLGLANGSGAWWLRYLLMNPGRGGCADDRLGSPVQVWAAWFQRGAEPKSFIQGFPLQGMQLSARGVSPFRFRVGENTIGEDSCRGHLQVDGHEVSWDLRYRSKFSVTLSDRGWIGFSRTAHSDAVFAGRISLDGRVFEGQPLGFGIQGHNCGYRHRSFWVWAHAFFPRAAGGASTFEALLYDVPLGLTARKAVLWHKGKEYVLRNLREETRDRQRMQWNLRGSTRDGCSVEAAIDGSGCLIHPLPYLKTDCSGSFEVANNSLARATIRLHLPAASVEVLETVGGAVLEVGGLS